MSDWNSWIFGVVTQGYPYKVCTTADHIARGWAEFGVELPSRKNYDRQQQIRAQWLAGAARAALDELAKMAAPVATRRSAAKKKTAAKR